MQICVSGAGRLGALEALSSPSPDVWLSCSLQFLRSRFRYKRSVQKSRYSSFPSRLGHISLNWPFPFLENPPLLPPPRPSFHPL